MTVIGDTINNREIQRKRYVNGVGWITSSDSFFARVQPKYSDAMNRTSMPTFEELFLNTAVFRDYEELGTSVETSFTFPTSGEALINAQFGTDIVDGDRLIEVDGNRTWIVRSVAEYRDSRLQHDEIICSEASHLDKKWIEPVNILTLTGQGGMDTLMNQYVSYDTQNYAVSAAFGATAFYDTERFQRDSQMMMVRSAKGKSISEPILLYMDVDFLVDENSLIDLRGIIWKVEFIRESFFRVYGIGLRPYKERDAYQTLIRRPQQERRV